MASSHEGWQLRGGRGGSSSAAACAAKGLQRRHCDHSQCSSTEIGSATARDDGHFTGRALRNTSCSRGETAALARCPARCRLRPRRHAALPPARQRVLHAETRWPFAAGGAVAQGGACSSALFARAEDLPHCAAAHTAAICSGNKTRHVARGTRCPIPPQQVHPALTAAVRREAIRSKKETELTPGKEATATRAGAG